MWYKISKTVTVTAEAVGLRVGLTAGGIVVWSPSCAYGVKRGGRNWKTSNDQTFPGMMLVKEACFMPVSLIHPWYAPSYVDCSWNRSISLIFLCSESVAGPWKCAYHFY